MTASLPLILRIEPVERGLRSRSTLAAPYEASVYVSADRKVAVVDDGRPLGRWEQLTTSYRYRYDVDISDHRRTVALHSNPLPARGNHWSFDAVLDVGFRVHDPAAVVRRNVRDALPVVYGHLRRRLAEITVRYDITQAAEAERAVVTAFGGGWMLPEGITIFDLSPRLRPESKFAKHVDTMAEMQHTQQAEQARHGLNVQAAVHRDELEQLAQRSRIAAEQRELAAIGSGELSARQIVLLHLARHPQDTERAMGLLAAHEHAVAQRQDAHNQHSAEFFRFLVDKKVVRPDQLELLVPGLVSQIGGLPASTPPGARPPIWSQNPALGGQADPPPDPGSGPPPATLLEQDPRSRVWRPVDGVQPIYVLVDESTEMGPYVNDLSDGAHRLYQQLREAKEASPVMLSMLGFADQVATRLPLKAVDQGSQSPWFTARGRSVTRTSSRRCWTGSDRTPRRSRGRATRCCGPWCTCWPEATPATGRSGRCRTGDSSTRARTGTHRTSSPAASAPHRPA
ncbi:hypothetical protein Jiend_62150 [Micromonospora endophytica]|uniref:hypothetical protein n=1 Tax=Micromonospora endophytica TaxID=515350 RepID=UPI001BB44BA1|nr:hypothetical protein [Micromonospora endophytica]BCJ62793.1 hypothetical protein Jiend_62150 [Micromonospora endophytica]